MIKSKRDERGVIVLLLELDCGSILIIVEKVALYVWDLGNYPSSLGIR